MKVNNTIRQCQQTFGHAFEINSLRPLISQPMNTISEMNILFKESDAVIKGCVIWIDIGA